MTDTAGALASFVRGELTPEALLAGLEPRVVVSREDGTVLRVDYAGEPIPHVGFTRGDVQKALDRTISGETTLDALSGWANLMTLLDCFDLDPDGEVAGDVVWDVLSRISHPELSGVSDTFRLRELRDRLAAKK